MDTERRRLLQPLWNALDRAAGNSWLLCVSGGPDSRALLEATARWPRRGAATLAVAVVDHRTRPESAAEAQAAAARARALGFDVDVLTLPAGLRGEAVLREARYRALARAAVERGLAALVTAHHAGDVAEGVLLSLIGQGGGPGGASMLDDAQVFGIAVVRPFLRLPRASLRLALVACAATDVFVDPDRASARARLRRSVLEPLGADRGDVEERLAHFACRRREDEEVLTATAAGVTDDTGAIRHGPPALVRRALMAAVRRAAPERDPRDCASGVAVALGLLLEGKRGHVDLAGAVIDVDPVGGARVAARPAATHDGESRLSGRPRMATVESR